MLLHSSIHLNFHFLIFKGVLKVNQSILNILARPRSNQDQDMSVLVSMVHVNAHASQNLITSLSVPTTTQDATPTTSLIAQPLQNVRVSSPILMHMGVKSKRLCIKLELMWHSETHPNSSVPHFAVNSPVLILLTHHMILPAHQMMLLPHQIILLYHLLSK